jgi:hypothetical protein
MDRADPCHPDSKADCSQCVKEQSHSGNRCVYDCSDGKRCLRGASNDDIFCTEHLKKWLTADGLGIVRTLSKAITDVYVGLEKTKHSNILCVQLAELCLYIRKAIGDSTTTASRIRETVTEIERLKVYLKRLEGKSLAWWYKFRENVNEQLTDAIRRLRTLYPDITSRPIALVFPTKRLCPYMYDAKLPDGMVDYAAFDFGTTFSKTEGNCRSEVDAPAIVSEMDMAAKATNLHAELTHLLLYYDERYKGSNNSNHAIENHRAEVLLPPAIEQWEKWNTQDNTSLENLNLALIDLKASKSILNTFENKIKTRDAQIKAARTKLEANRDFKRWQGGIEFLKERWANRKASLIDTISELLTLDVEGKLARLRDSLRYAEIVDTDASRNEAYRVVVGSPSISAQGQGTYLTIAILEKSGRSVLVNAIQFLTPQLVKWKERKNALSQGLQQIGCDPWGTEKTRSEGTAVSSVKRPSPAEEKLRLCQSAIEDLQRNIVDMKQQLERATTSDATMRKRAANTEIMEDKLNQCERELELLRTKAKFHLCFTELIGVILAMQPMMNVLDEDSEDEDGVEKNIHPIVAQFENTKEAFITLSQKLDKIWGEKNRVNFMIEILDHALPLSGTFASPFFRSYQATRESIIDIFPSKRKRTSCNLEIKVLF